MFPRFRPAVFALLPLLAGVAQAGNLVIGDVTFNGDTVTVPVTLESASQGISALDFRLQYDAGVFETVDVAAGAAAGSSGKQVLGNTIAPGDFKVLMFGINQETFTSGEVANITLRVKDAPADGNTTLQINDVTLSLPNATDLPSDGGSFPVRFPGGETPPEENEGQAEEPTQDNPPRDPEGQPEQPSTPASVSNAPLGQGANSPDRPSSLDVPSTNVENDSVSSRDDTLANLSEEARRRAADLRAQLPQGGAAEAVVSPVDENPEKTIKTAPEVMAETAPPDTAPVDLPEPTVTTEPQSAQPSGGTPVASAPKGSKFGTAFRAKILGLGAGIAILAGLIALRKWIFP